MPPRPARRATPRRSSRTPPGRRRGATRRRAERASQPARPVVGRAPPRDRARRGNAWPPPRVPGDPRRCLPPASTSAALLPGGPRARSGGRVAPRFRVAVRWEPVAMQARRPRAAACDPRGRRRRRARWRRARGRSAAIGASTRRHRGVRRVSRRRAYRPPPVRGGRASRPARPRRIPSRAPTRR